MLRLGQIESLGTQARDVLKAEADSDKKDADTLARRKAAYDRATRELKFRELDKNEEKAEWVNHRQSINKYTEADEAADTDEAKAWITEYKQKQQAAYRAKKEKWLKQEW
jgi:hypothetical protein